jgi:hypothetical protein
MALPLSTLSTNARIVQEPRRAVILRTPTPTPTPAPTPTPMTMVRAQRPQNVSPAPAVAAPVPPAPQGKTYSGELITLDLKNVDLKDFFKFISDLSGKNFVLDPGVNGTLTLQMRDVPWDQVLDIVMGNHNLAATLEGNVMRVRQAKDVITVDFDISRNGTRLSAPRISTVAGITATLMQDTLKITMMPTRLAPDRVSVDFEFSYGETVLKANVVLGNQDPATVTVRSGADSFALSIRLVVSK